MLRLAGLRDVANGLIGVAFLACIGIRQPEMDRAVDILVSLTMPRMPWLDADVAAPVAATWMALREADEAGLLVGPLRLIGLAVPGPCRPALARASGVNPA